MWYKEGHGYSAQFKLTSKIDNYELTLPKVVFARLDSYGVYSVSGLSFSYISQPITVTKPITFCEVGVGLGLGDVGIPSSLEIRSMSETKPGNVIYTADIHSKRAAISLGYETPLFNFCDKNASSKVLSEGMYWITAKYNQRPPLVNVHGARKNESEVCEILTSNDGVNWEVTPTERNFKFINVYFVE